MFLCVVYSADTGSAYSQLNIQSYFKVHSATSSEPQTADTERLPTLVLQKSKSEEWSCRIGYTDYTH